ncbi:MAG: glycosyltransferase family 39 protein [Candidatus Omnitrophota bacterium]|nr:glycosyltransferase family 39 protein [Candidatus Omnitrophota bacterium]
MNLRTFILKNKTILILFLLALTVRLLYVLFFSQFPLLKDDLQYNMIAKNILDGNGFSYDSVKPTAARGPLYPLFLAATYFVFGYDYNTARILQAIIGAITCLLIYFIAKKLYNQNIGFYAFVIASIYPSLIGYSGLLYSETLAAFLVSLTILFYILSSEKKSFLFFVITGISFGLLILCYPKFLFLPVLSGFSIYFFNEFRKEFFKYFFALIVGVVFILTPWTLRNIKEFGKFIPVATGAGTALWYSTLPEDDTGWRFDREPLLSEFKRIFHGRQTEDEQHEFLFSVKTNEVFAEKALMNIKSNPVLFIKLSVKRFFRQWLASNGNSFYALRGATGSYLLDKHYSIFFAKLFLALLQICIIVFGCLGIIIDFNSDRKNFFSPVLLSIIYASFINSIFMTSPRYQIPVLGLLFIYTVLGTQWAFSMVQESIKHFPNTTAKIA